MRRFVPLLAVLAAFALAFPAVAATPKNGTFKGTGTYKATDGSTIKADVVLKVKNGKVSYVSAFTHGQNYGQATPFSPALKVKSGGKFSGSKKIGTGTMKVKGRFTKPGKAVGTVEVVNPKDTTGYGSYPMTKFTVRHK